MVIHDHRLDVGDPIRHPSSREVLARDRGEVPGAERGPGVEPHSGDDPHHDVRRGEDVPDVAAGRVRERLEAHDAREEGHAVDAVVVLRGVGGRERGPAPARRRGAEPELRSRGYRLGLISNAFPSAVRIIHDLQLRDYFEYKYTFLSFEIPDKYIKPEPEIYRYSSKKANVDIRRTLFVDDRWPFVKAALDVGMDAYLIERFSEENKQLVTKSLVPKIYDLYELRDRVLNGRKPAPSLSDAKQSSENNPPMNMPTSLFAPT